MIEQYYVNGRPDIILVDKDKKIAVEIETAKSDFIGNIKKALEADFDKIICIATNKFVEEKIRRELKAKDIVDGRARVVGVYGF